jgi:hypothetical protein
MLSQSRKEYLNQLTWSLRLILRRACGHSLGRIHYSNFPDIVNESVVSSNKYTILTHTWALSRANLS